MKGPWKWSEDGGQIIDADGRSVIRIRPSDATEEEFDAIAAAPDLLAACEALTACYDAGDYADALDRVVMLARDAAAKARGTER
jgi:hypothetical protein